MSRKVKKDSKLKNKKIHPEELKNISGGNSAGIINVKPGANQNPAVAPSKK